MLPRLAGHAHLCRSCTDQVPHCLMFRVFGADLIHWSKSGSPLPPYSWQLASPVQLRQHDRITPIRLYPVARLYRDERGRNDNTLMPHPDELAVQTIAARRRFIAEVQPRTSGSEFRDQLADLIGPVLDRPPVPHFAVALSLRDGDGDRRLMDIPPDERRRVLNFPHDLPPCVVAMEACGGAHHT